jgi:hypothetical protein
MAKQYTKYELNIWKIEEKKCVNLIISDIFLSPSAITWWKIIGSTPNSSAENWFTGLTDGRTDGRTECKPKVLFDFVGRGLEIIIKCTTPQLVCVLIELIHNEIKTSPEFCINFTNITCNTPTSAVHVRRPLQLLLRLF